MSLRVALVLFLFASVACGQADVTELPSPAGRDAMAPFLSTARDGRVLMSWLEPVAGKRYSLKFASYAKGSWTEARTIVTRDDFFVNWADFPSIVADARGTLFAHWLQKNGDGTYSYDVHVTSSPDGGKSWRPSRVLHTDGKQAEHGFVSMVPRERGVAIVWLDGREMTMDDAHGHGGGAMTVRYANLDPTLVTSGETLLDPRACECCTTAMTMTSSGPVVAYRDRSEEEIRDISVTRLLPGGRWSQPAPVHKDNWKINGCPVNGPQMDARGGNVVVAWFTSGGGQPKVNVAFSKNAGASFAAPIRVDAGKPAGRADVQLLRDGSALVTWIETQSEGASIMTRRVSPDGRMRDPKPLGSTTAARAAGFPRTTMVGDREVWFSWTEPGTPRKVRVAKLKV
ncbi:MAG TPA: sialidase family protein [Thermoanaerobaculia bacterium]|jgi:hypothetical protein